MNARVMCSEPRCLGEVGEHAYCDRCFEVKLEAAEEAGYDRGKREGHDAGYDAGYDIGYKEAKDGYSPKE